MASVVGPGDGGNKYIAFKKIGGCEEVCNSYFLVYSSGLLGYKFDNRWCMVCGLCMCKWGSLYMYGS